MRALSTLNLYFLKRQLWWVFGTFTIILAIIFVGDSIEHFRRISSGSNTDYLHEFKIILFKLPHLGEILLPYAFLIGSAIAFSKIALSNEFIVARAGGISLSKPLIPIAIVSLLISLMLVFIGNPAASSLYKQHLLISEGRGNDKTYNDVWLREKQTNGDRLFIYAPQVHTNPVILDSPTFYLFKSDSEFAQQYDATTAYLEEGKWILKHVMQSNASVSEGKVNRLIFPTVLTEESLLPSLMPPEALSFWEFLPHIRMLQSNGLDAQGPIARWAGMIMTPFLIFGLILCAGAFCLRMNRRRGGMMPVVKIIALGFAIYILRDILMAMASTKQIPVLLAALSPPLALTFYGIASIFVFEEPAP